MCSVSLDFLGEAFGTSSQEQLGQCCWTYTGGHNPNVLQSHEIASESMIRHNFYSVNLASQ